MLKKIFKARWCYLALLPTLLFLVIFTLYPAIESLYKSMYLWKTANFFAPRFIGFDNYIKLFQDADFWKSFGNLLIFAAAAIFTLLGINMPITYLVYKLCEKKIGKKIQTAYIIPIMIPGMVMTLYWRFFYEYQNGILNSILRSVGLESLASVWLGTNGIALVALLFVGFPFVGGFGYLIFLAAFQGIDKSIQEAAEVDGIGPVRRFFQIDLPMIKPQMMMLTMLQIITALQAYDNQLILTSGRYGTMVPGLDMYQTAFVGGNYGYATAMGVILFVIIFIATSLQNSLKNRAED